MHRLKLPALAATVTLVLSGLSAPAQAAPPAVPVAKAGKGSTSVTLITGDRVTVNGTKASVQPGPGRAKVRFVSQASGGHRYVIPYDALALLRDGRIDKRL